MSFFGNTVKINCKAAENYSLTIRNGDVVLAPDNPRDEFQYWYKDLRFSNTVKDENGFPSFAFINKATSQAIKHSIGARHPVRLLPYNPDYLDESVLWSESCDLGDGFCCIRMVNNIRLNFDAFQGVDEHGGVQDGTNVFLFEWNKGKNQRWKIVPYGQEFYDVPPTRERTMRIFSNAAENYSPNVRNGEVVLAPANLRDEFQYTVKINCKAVENCSLTVRNGEVVLAPANTRDEFQDKIIKSGVWGGSAGSARVPTDGTITSSTVLKRIIINYDNYAIRTFKVDYEYGDGRLASYGPWGCHRFAVEKWVEEQVSFQDGEILTSIEGTYEKIYLWLVVVTSLTFKTNKGHNKTIGHVGGTKFSFEASDGKIVGFHGNFGVYLDAIGIYLAPN